MIHDVYRDWLLKPDPQCDEDDTLEGCSDDERAEAEAAEEDRLIARWEDEQG